MIPVYQTNFSVPGGNCLQACLASLFELPLEEVPDFANLGSDDWWTQCQDWCYKKFGVYPIHTHLAGSRDATMLHGYYLITLDEGIHAVVARGGEVVHDPFPLSREDNRGLIPCGYILFVSGLESVK